MLNIWEEAAENDALWKKENMKALLRKKKGVLNLDDMSVGEEMLYHMTKSQLKEALEEYAEEERNEMMLQKRVEAELEKFGARKKREEAAKNPPVMKQDTSLAARAAEAIAKSDVAHAGAVMAQRVSDNPLSHKLLSVYENQTGNKIERVEARNRVERGLEAAAGAVNSAILASIAGGRIATSKAVTRAAMSGGKYMRKAAKAVQYAALPGAEGAQIGAAAGGAALPAMVNLQKTDSRDSKLKKATYAAAEVGLGAVGAAALGGLGGAAHQALNHKAIKKGIKQVKQSLATKEFKDIKLGEFSRKALAEINEIRLTNKIPLMRDNNLMVPKNVGKHIYERRIEGNRLDASKVAENVSEIMNSKNVRVRSGNCAENQELSVSYKGKRSAYVGYVTIDNISRKNILLTTMKKEAKRLDK